MDNNSTNTAPVIITDKAAGRIREIAAAQGEATALRISVNGGGCSGFQYDFALETTPKEDDMIIEQGGAKIFIDPISLPFMSGATLDFSDELTGQAFRIKNPVAKSSCGCGISFTV